MNLQEYLETEFSRFSEKPFNELDAAIFTQLAMVRVELAAQGHGGYDLGEDGYLRHESTGMQLSLTLRDLLCAECLDQMFTGLAADHVRQCLMAAAMSPRYRQVRITRYQSVFDASRQVQFSATTFSSQEFTFVGFRGTDASLTGWREDFNLAFMNPVPAQTLAVEYVKSQMKEGVSGPLYMGGHSKGGNLAEYVLLKAPAKRRGTIAQTYSFDGPGFKAGAFASVQFRAIAPRFRKLVPQDSIIGMILDSGSAFEVVESTQLGFMQHDLFSWEVLDDAFVRREGLSIASRALDEATQEWIHSYSDQEISSFVNALFHAAESSGALDLETLFCGGVESIRYLRAAANSVDDEYSSILKRFAGDLAEAIHVAAKDQAEQALRGVRLLGNRE